MKKVLETYDFVKEYLTDDDYKEIKNLKLIKKIPNKNILCIKEKSKNILFFESDYDGKEGISFYKLIVDKLVYSIYTNNHLYKVNNKKTLNVNFSENTLLKDDDIIELSNILSYILSFIYKDINFNFEDINGMFKRAIWDNDINRVKYFLDNGISPMYGRSILNSPLCYSISLKRNEITRLLTNNNIKNSIIAKIVLYLNNDKIAVSLILILYLPIFYFVFEDIYITIFIIILLILYGYPI
ncbi:hypothetical protein ACMC56_08635 [Campylobacterota bacterium DY0563]